MGIVARVRSVASGRRLASTDGRRDIPETGAPNDGDVQLFRQLPARRLFLRDAPSWRDQLKRFILGRELVLSPSHMGLIEEATPGRIGVCCSGGGIRSAAFNLGALQTLQRVKVLQKAKYLAAVSGGSYIAAAFAMVVKTGDPESDDSNPSLMTDEKPPFYRGSPEEQYLRNRSSYMAPGGGGLIRLVLRVALGLAVNLALLAAALFLIAWAIAIIYRQLYPGLGAPPGKVTAYADSLWYWIPAGLGALGLTLGLVGIFLPSGRDYASKALETISLWLLALALVVLALDKGLPELIAYLRNQGVAATPKEVSGAPHVIAPVVGGTFSGLLATVALELRTKLSPKAVEADISWFQKLSGGVQRAIGQAAIWVVGPALLVGLLVFWMLLFVSAHHISWVAVVVVVALFIGFFLRGDVTTWSLHPFYRRRLCTAFALKRVARDSDSGGEAVERSYSRMVPLGRSDLGTGAAEGPTGPTLLVCAAANISDAGITPPGRSVTSFTFSRGSIGGPLVGGVNTGAYERLIAHAHRGKYSLPAAVAMSGAAISPSMGKETRPSFRFLLGLANVRLGVWVPNPRRMDLWEEPAYLRRLKRRGDGGERADHVLTLPKGAETPDGAQSNDPTPRRLTYPRPGPQYLLKEMLGWTTINDRYLYVTDGGHYDNLGLVELLRRGCTEIYCFDASGGESPGGSGGKALTSLGDAIALARSELDIEIAAFNHAPLAEDGDRVAEQCCVLGKIVFPADEAGQKIADGTLVYVRSVVTKSAPYDVQAFRINDPAFPHHSTFDQLYTDQKFEAYRELGAHASDEAVKAVNSIGHGKSWCRPIAKS